MENKLIRDLKKGMGYAFEEIYNQYYRLVYFVAFSILKSRESAEEIVQDAFLKMYEKIDQYHGYGKFKAWLLSITRHLSINRLKSENRVKNQVIYDNDSVESIKDIVSLKNDFLLELHECLNELETNIVVFHLIYGFKFHDIAKELSLTLNVVKKSYYKSIDKLKKYYSNWEDAKNKYEN